MPFDVIIGRDKKERERLGTKGAVFLGKQYVKMGQVTSLSNEIYLDVVNSLNIESSDHRYLRNQSLLDK